MTASFYYHLPEWVGDGHDREAAHADQGEVLEARVGLDRGEGDGGDGPGGDDRHRVALRVGRGLRDADDGLHVPGVIDRDLVAFLDGPQVLEGEGVLHARP